MVKRQLIQIPPEQVQKLKELEELRKDLEGYPISKKVHILLQEKLKDEFQKKPSEDFFGGDWIEYIREVLPTHIFGPIAIGTVKYSKEMIGEPFTKFFVASEGDKTWWFAYGKDIENIGKYLLNNFKNKKFAEAYFLKYNKVIEDFRKISQKISKEDFTKLSKKKLLEKYNRFNEDFMRFIALSMDIDAIDIYLEKKMKDKFQEMVEKKGKELRKREFNSQYSLLTSPTEFSYLNLEEISLLKLAKEIKERKIGIDDPKIKDKINKIVKEFWWTSLGWTQRKENDLSTYVAKIEEMLSKDIEQELKEINKSLKRVRKKKKDLAKEYDFDDEMNFYLKIFEEYVILHDYRKEDQMRGTSIMNKFLLELEKRDGLQYDELVWAWPDEIKEYIKTGTIDLEKVRNRKGAFVAIVGKNNIEQFTGEQAIRLRKKIMMAEDKKIQDFEGIGVSLGKVTGRAKVCYSSADAVKKIKKGDVLVASMTQPEFVTSMKKAVAIVTDEGGITCHAAIVSREIGIPCLVGTKIATRVLKDNDLIEVNANHGRVKILRKNGNR